MIKSITITNHVGDSIKLELTRPDKSGFIVKSVEGLGPVKATINTSKVAMRNGVKYNSSYLNSRDIVMNLEFYQTDTETIEDLRHKSYEYFRPDTKIQMVIETDRRICKTEGYVEDNTPNIFSDKEGCSITILCDDPLLYSVENNDIVFSGIESNFEFPFSIEETSPISFSDMLTHTTGSVFYTGEYSVGCVIYITAIGPASNITIYNSESRTSMRIETSKLPYITGVENDDITTGDMIVIDTREKHKTITLLRNGLEINIFNCIGRDTKWFSLIQGSNTFTYDAEEGKENLHFRIVNAVAYGGI